MKVLRSMAVALAAAGWAGTANAAITFDIGPGWGAEVVFSSPTPVILWSDQAVTGVSTSYRVDGEYRTWAPGSIDNPEGHWAYGGLTSNYNAVGTVKTQQATLGSYFGGTGTLRFMNTDGQKVTITFADDISGTVSRLALPEPATWAMMLIGFGAIGSAMRRRLPKSEQFARV